MIIRIFYTFIFLLFLPISGLLIFKPKLWQSLYAKFYFEKLESKGGLLKVLGKSILSMTSSDFAEIIHQSIGIFLAVFEAYIFFMKLKVISIP